MMKNKYRKHILYFAASVLMLSSSIPCLAITLEDDGLTLRPTPRLSLHNQSLGDDWADIKASHHVSVPSANHTSLVFDEGGNQVRASVFLKSMHDISLDMNDLSYAIGKGQTARIAEQKTRLMAEGWTNFRDIIGKSGRDNSTYDIPGFIAYNPRYNVVMVTIRGSATSADWSTNFDAERVSARSIGLDMDGMVHRGFGIKYKAMEDSLLDNMNQLLDSLSPEQKKNIQVVVTGHSQGGGVAPIALTQLVKKLGPSHWGATFSNAVTNKFKGIWFSAARAWADEAAAADADRTVGKLNRVRHNMGSIKDDAIITIQDPVPNLSLNTTWQQKVAGLPVIGPYLAKQYGGFYDDGYLMMDDSIEAIKRITPQGALSVVKKSGSNFVDMLKDKLTPGLTSPLKVASLPLSILEWGWDSAKGVVVSLFAPVHGGSTVSDSGGAFDPKAFGRNLDIMLQKGAERTQAKPAPAEKPIETSNPIAKAGQKIVEGAKKLFRFFTGN